MLPLLRLKSFGYGVALLCASIVVVAYAQSNSNLVDQLSVTSSNTPDDATLNLHRWGAVTLFHGLPSDRVRAIIEDQSGAIWIGTDNGLVRYDGRNTQAFAQESALPSRRILALAVDVRGALWIGTENGAARWRNEKLTVLEETRGRAINGLAAANDAVVAVTSQGELLRFGLNGAAQPSSQVAEPRNFAVGKLDASNHRLLTLADQNGSLQPLNLTSIAAAANGEFFLGSGGRGAMIHRALTGEPSDQLRELTLQPPRPYHLNAVFAAGDNIWLGEQSGKTPGLWLYENGNVIRQPFATGTVTAIHGGLSGPTNKDTDVWVGTFAQGAFLLRNGQVLEHLTFENTGGGLRANRITALYRDRDGIVWFGTERGVCRYDRESFRAARLSDKPSSNFVRAISQTTDGTTWCGTDRGLFQLAVGADLGPWREIVEVQGRAVYVFWEEAGGLWLGTSSGLYLRAQNAALFERVPLQLLPQAELANENLDEPAEQQAGSATSNAQIPNPQSRESVRALARFRGALYAAVYAQGVARLETNKPTSWLNENEVKNALCLAVEGEQTLWLGTLEGRLLRYDGAQFQTVNWQTQNSGAGKELAVRALALAGKRLWIGTGNGLYLREDENVRQVLPHADVFSLQVTHGAEGREIVWCGTRNSGLIKYLPTEDVSMRFDTEQGLASSQVFAIAVPPNAEHLWIGTNRGVVRHQPSSAPPHLEVRRLVANEIYLPDALLAELALPSTQRNFLLEVAALGGRTFPGQFQYEFAIERRDGSERRVVKTQDAQFAVENLRTGPYTVSARAISRDLAYSAPLILKLRVQNAPFPWSTVLLAAGLVAALAGVFLIFRQRQRLTLSNTSLEKTNAELQAMRIRLANETEAERARIARDLHDQTLGDLRHLLVLTDQLPKAESGGLEGHVAVPNPAVLRREIESISNEIRHICEDLSPSVLANIGFLPALEWALSDAVAHLPASEKFAYEFICAPALEDRLRMSATEEIQLYRIVQEALNNICRHARARHVRLSVSIERERDLLIEVCDDGVGFVGEAGENVTGYGIANIRSRANLIGAQVSWQAAVPGCRFQVRQRSVVS